MRHAPSHWHVIRSIARRELGIASRRKLVRLLFLFSLGPPLVFGIILIVRIVTERTTGMDLGWDPVLRFMQVQSLPVILLSLGLGTPLVARDRAEEVLYLYAVRPVTPWHYAMGKMLTVAAPALLLLLAPAILIAVVRQGVMPDDITTWSSILLVGKTLVAAVFLALAYAGVSVGPSAATKRARWALLLAFLFFAVPDIVPQIIWGSDAVALSPGKAVDNLLESLYEGRDMLQGFLSALVLAAYGVVGAWVTMSRVRREMIP